MRALMTKRILVVEEDDLQREIVSLMLEDSDCELHLVDSSQQAMDEIQLHEFDVIVMEVAMPHDGAYAAAAMRQCLADKTTQFIAAGAKNFHRHAKQWARFGFNDCLSKPFLTPDLERLVA